MTGSPTSTKRVLRVRCTNYYATTFYQGNFKKVAKKPKPAAKSVAKPTKTARKRKSAAKNRHIAQAPRTDFFDKRVMEVIKHRLSVSVDPYTVNGHDCKFRSEILAKRVFEKCEREILIRWHPRFILDDEWVPESKFSATKLVPIRQIPTKNIRRLYPFVFPLPRHEKASRKRTRQSDNLNLSSSSSSSSTLSEGSSSSTIISDNSRSSSPSPTSSPHSCCTDYLTEDDGSEIANVNGDSKLPDWALETLYEDLGIDPFDLQ